MNHFVYELTFFTIFFMEINKIVWNTILVTTIVIYSTVHNLFIIQMYFFIFFGADFINLFTSDKNLYFFH